MRIIYLNQYFNTPAMLGSTRSYEMGRRLVTWGHEVQMVTSIRKRRETRLPSWTETQEDGIHVHWCPVPYRNEMTYAQRMLAFVQFAWKAAHKAASLKGDLVFATSTPLTIALPAIYAARRRRIPMVFEVRDLWPELPIAVGALKSPIMIAFARWLERIAYNNSARVVALSPGMKAGIVRAGYPPQRVHVIPNAADLEFFDVLSAAGARFRERFDWLGERPLVVYTGTMGLINGVGYLARLAAAAQKLDPEIRFLVVGKGAEHAQVRDEAVRLAVLNKSFFMLEAVPKAEIPSVLSAATMATSLCINLSQLWANSANKFFDALAAGRPIGINYEGWQADLLRETGAGIVLDASNPELAAKQVVSAVRNSTWLEQAGRSARMLAEKKFARENLTRQLEAVLEEVLDET